MKGSIYWGMQPDHSPCYGINHKYIAKELTNRNWKRKAIVRAGIYLYVVKGTISVDNTNSKKCIYGVHGERGEGIDVDFDTLKEAIFYANNYSDHEGVYPKEKGSSWTIHVGPLIKTENKSPKPEKTEKEEASTLNSRERLLEKELSRLLLKKLPNREKLVKSSGTAYQFAIPAKKNKVNKKKK